MNDIEVLIVLLAVAAGAVWLAGAVSIPYPILLLLAGVGIGFLPGMPSVELGPDVIFLVFLPPLLHAAAWTSSPKHLRAFARPLGLLAIGNVVAGTAAVAVAAHLVVPDMGWGPAFVLGAILAPTDTVAATTVFRRLGVPDRVVMLVEGESLVNDGAALVFWRIGIAGVASGAFSAVDAVRDLVIVGAGGALVGLVIGYVVAHVHRRLEDPLLSIMVSLLTPYVAWIGAEHLGLSGILAAVSSGIYLGWRSVDLFNPSTRLQAAAFWSAMTFILESTLFLLMGLQFPGVLEALDDESPVTLVVTAAVVAAAVILARLAFQLSAMRLEGMWEARRGTHHLRLSGAEDLVVGWSGMRGAVSLAAALAVPLTTDAGGPFPHREEMIFLTLTTIGATLVLQGLTLPRLIRRLDVEDEAVGGLREQAQARFRSVEAALARISELSFDPDTNRDAVERARDMYAERAQQLTAACRDGIPDTDGSDAALRRLRLDLLAVERSALIELRDSGRVKLGTFQRIQEDLDIEQQRLLRSAPVDRPAASPPATVP